MKLSDLIVDTKEAWVPFDDIDGFEVLIASISRQEMVRLYKSCTITKLNKKTRQMEEETDKEKWAEKFSKAAVKNWRGLTVEALSQLVTVNAEGVDPKTEIEYSEEQALDLLNASVAFDLWLNEAVADLNNFRR